MKKIFQSITIIFALTGLLLLNACTDNFQEINTRQDRLTSVDPDLIFGLSPAAVLGEMSSNNNWYMFGNYGNQWSVIGGTGPHFGFDGRAERIWNNLYSNGLNPLYSIIKNYKGNPAYPNRVAIAHIWKAYIFSQLTAMYGPCPYTQACNGLAGIPFDPEEVVYRGILKELKDAYTALQPSTTDVYPAEADPFLGGNIDRWKKFAHCIRLRTAIRLTEVPETWSPGLATEARAIVAEELDNGENGMLISDKTGAEDFTMQFSMSNQNPLNVEVISNPELATTDPGNFPVLHESLSLWIRPETYNDPFLNAMCTAGSGGTARSKISKYLGRPHSMETPSNGTQGYQFPTGWSSPYSNLKYGDFAQVGKVFNSLNAYFDFFTYSELCFIRAEATLKQYWTKGKTADQYYYDGIDARCNNTRLLVIGKLTVQQTAIDAYKNSKGIKWSTSTDTTSVGTGTNKKWGSFSKDYLGGFVNCYLGGPEDNFKRIIVQHWISLFSRNIDIWTLLRRTEIIDFKPHFGADLNNGYVNSRWAFTPERLIYPGNERIINKTEAFKAIDTYLLDKGNASPGQQDQITYRLIFAKDNDGLHAINYGKAAYNAYPSDIINHTKNRDENNPLANQNKNF